MVSKFLPLSAILFLISCGGTVSDSDIPSGSTPVLIGVNPVAALRGDSVELQGVGFSLVPQENIIIAGGSSTVAVSYNVTEEGSEVISFVVPTDALMGVVSLFVTVEGEPSNALPFTVVPN